MSCIKHYSLMLLLVIMTASAARGGTLVNTGGDPWAFLQLELQRKIYIRTLEQILANDATDWVKTEEALSRMCAASGLYDKFELNTCVDYILTTAADIAQCNHGDNKIDFKVIRPTEQWEIDLFDVQYPDTPHQTVPAATYLSNCREPSKNPRARNIYFHYDRIRDWNGRDAFLAIAHEMGHKVMYRSHAVTDDQRAGGFEAGYKLLNAAAYAVFLYSGAFQNPANPQKITPEEEKEQDRYEAPKHFFQCHIQAGEAKNEFQLITEVTEKNQDNGNYVARNTVQSWGYDVSNFTRDLFPIDRFYLSVFIQGNDRCNQAASQSPYFSFALLHKNPGGKDNSIVANSQTSGNITCQTEHQPFILKYESLMIECMYEGYHSL